MAATIAFYNQGDRAALAAWNGGEGQNTSSYKGKVGVYTNEMPPLTPRTLATHKLAGNINRTGMPWMWGSSHATLQGPVHFREDGHLDTPWGVGSWGEVPSVWRNDSLHAIVDNETYLIMFLSEKWAFVAVRCSDEQVSYGRLLANPIPERRLVW